MGSQQEHIVMLPFMAQGHIIPFLALAKQVQQRTGFTITIANTPLNIQYLRTTISTTSDDSSRPCIRLAELPFCSSDHGLPPNTENTEALSFHQIVDLFHASKTLQAPFHSLVSGIIEKEGRPPLCIISDVFFGWATEVAKSLGTSNVTFTTGGGYGTAAYISLWQNLPHRATDSDYFALPGFPDSCRFHITQLHQYLRAADGTDAWSRYFQPQIALSLDSSGWLCNTAEEIEPHGLEILRNHVKPPVWTIGPLLPPALLNHSLSSGSSIFGQRAWKVPGVSPEKCLDWLDKHPQSSVLYISFGSQNTISPSQMMELALGLEDSGKPFIWVIRPPVGFDIEGEFRAEWLPENFEQRMAESNQGLIVHKWAPQLEILSHKSTGVFVSHCGWNSVMESLCVGVPIIGWPLAAEQCYNSKMLTEDMGVALELTRGRQGALERKEVKRVIELVMDSKGKGEEMKKKATEIGEKIRDAMREGGSSLKAMDDFVSTMLSKRQGY